MASIPEEQVKKIAALSNIRLEGKDLKNLTQDFNQILEFVQKINEVDTNGVEEMRHVLPYETIFQDERASNHVDIQDIQRMSPKLEGGYFVVPQVIETQ